MRGQTGRQGAGSHEPRTENAADALTIGYWPTGDGANLYTARMREILSQLGEVVPFPHRLTLLGSDSLLASRRKVDVAVINWFENKLIGADGRVSPRGLAKLLAQTLLFRARARKLVFVRHNRYPHGTAPQHAQLATRLIDAYEWLFDLTLTHSWAEATERRRYCPHPLYRSVSRTSGELAPALELAPGYLLAFGRIERYKRLEPLIAQFPPSCRLLVVGSVAEPEYAEALRRASPEHVMVVPGFVDEATAQRLLARSAGLILSHAEDDMIVSGSFFYAISFGRPVWALESPFIRLARARLGSAHVRCAADVASLCALIAREGVSSKVNDDSTPTSAVLAEFGDENVLRHLRQVIT